MSETTERVVWSVDGFTAVEPDAPRADVVAALAGDAVPAEGARCFAGIVTTRRRVPHPETRQRVTRDWRTAVVVMWGDDGAAPTFDLSAYRAVLAEISTAGGADDVVVHARIAALFPARRYAFRQFMVRSQRPAAPSPPMSDMDQKNEKPGLPDDQTYAAQLDGKLSPDERDRVLDAVVSDPDEAEVVVGAAGVLREMEEEDAREWEDAVAWCERWRNWRR